MAFEKENLWVTLWEWDLFIVLPYKSIVVVRPLENRAQVTFKGTLGEFHNFWQHCTNYNMSI